MDTHCVSIRGYPMKEAGLRIRLEPELRAAFIQKCRAKGVPAAQVIRTFMREYVQNQLAQEQGDLFETLHASNHKVG